MISSSKEEIKKENKKNKISKKNVKKEKVKVEDLLSSALSNATLYVSDSRLLL